jgi:hypothetical protein
MAEYLGPSSVMAGPNDWALPPGTVPSGLPPDSTYVPGIYNQDGTYNSPYWIAGKQDLPDPPGSQTPADGCPTCKGKTQIKTKKSFGPLYTTSTTNLDGSGTSYGFGVQSALSSGPPATSLCTQYGDTGGISSTVGGSLLGNSAQSAQGLASPFSDSANATQICTPITPSLSTGVSLGFGGFK